MMKNKKGFTIIEIVAVIAILIVIAGLFSVNMIKSLNKNKDEEREILVSTVKSAADAYVSANPDVVERLYNGYGYADLKVGDLKKAGLISAGLKDPETGELLDDNAVVRAKLDNTATAKDVVTFTYPVSGEELNSISYRLVASTLYVDYSDSTTSSQWCSNESNTHNGIQILDDQDAGNIYTGSIEEFNIDVVSCNVNPQSSGTYNIKYTYTDIETNEEKTYTRVVYVKAAEEDVMSFEVEINEGATIALNAPSIPTIIREKSGSTINVVSTNIIKDSNTYKLENTNYSIEGFSTTTAGTFKATVSSLKVNSDGSKPSSVKVSYDVNSSLIEIARATGDCTPVNNVACYYMGTQDNNFVRIYNKNYRIYYMQTNHIKLIYSGTDISSSYGMISRCSPTSCCNGGRMFYDSLNETTIFNKTATMTAVLNDFYTKYISGKTSYLTSINSSDSKSRNISLLGKDDYIIIGKCNSSGDSCVSNYIGNTWLFERSKIVRPSGAYNSGAAELYHYVVNGRNISTKGVTIEGGNRALKENSLEYTVKPVIQLKNPKISGGQGTADSPWIIE